MVQLGQAISIGIHVHVLYSISIKSSHINVELHAIAGNFFYECSVGRTCNFAVVMAILYIKGVNHGMHGFLVQLRSRKDHKLLPGI